MSRLRLVLLSLAIAALLLVGTASAGQHRDGQMLASRTVLGIEVGQGSLAWFPAD